MALISIDTKTPQYKSDVQTLTRLIASMHGTLAILKKAPPAVAAAWLARDSRLAAIEDLVRMFQPYMRILDAARPPTAPQEKRHTT